MDTEILATSAVKNRIAQTKYLSPFINEGDREPSWDGFIYAYENLSKKKDKLTGRAAVQVKGVQRKSLKQKSISFSMDRADLENYRTDGGIILFVVYIRADYHEKIYYASLTPFYLNEILKVQGTKKKPKVSLRALPDNPDELCNIVFNFIRDSRRQSIVRDGHIWTFEEVAKLFGTDNIELNFTYTGIGYDRKDPFSFLSKNDIYMYAQNKEKTITIPIQHLAHIDMQMQERDARIQVGEIEYTDRIRFAQHRNGKTVLSIGKSFSFVTEKGKTIFKYHLMGNLDERIRTIETLFAMIEDKYISVNTVKIDVFPEAKELETANLEERKQQLEYFKVIKETLDKLNIKEPLEVEKLTEKEENNLRMLVNAIIYGRPASFVENTYIPPVCTLDIANLKIVLTFNQNKDGKYTVEDFFTTKMICALDPDGKFRTTPFCILRKEDYLQDANLVLNKVVEDFKEYDNDGHMQKMVLCILEMIKAYDEDNSRGDLLEAAKDLCLWMEEKKPDEIIYRINYLQCCKRERDLDSNELDKLSNIISNEAADYSILAGAHILLGSKMMAKSYIEKLDYEHKREFEDYPIYTLFQQL